MRILVTGAAGFIGSHVAQALLARGDTVVGLDDFNDYYPPSRKEHNVEEVRAACPDESRLELVRGDVRDRDRLDELFRRHGFDAVVHLAAMAGVRASVEHPALYYDVNLTGTLAVLDAVRAHGRPNVVLASTSSVYGRADEVPFVEADPADRPLAPYPASKRAAELLAHSYCHLHGLDVTALRFFTVYGPRGRPDMMPWKILDHLYLGREVPLYDGGRMLRDWTYVGDVVQGVVAATERRLGYEVINIGRGEPIVVADFIAAMERHTGKRHAMAEQPMVASDVPRTYASIDKARRLLGYEPRTSVEQGTAAFVQWYRRVVLDVI